MTPDEHLPDALARSTLPWRPVHDHQARAPRDGDGWTAQLGGLQLLLLATQWANNPPLLELRLVNSLTDREISCWHLPTLLHASIAAESVVRTRLDDLLQDVRRRLHDAP